MTAAEKGSPRREVTDKLTSCGELSLALLCEVRGTVSMGLFMGRGVSKFKSIQQSHQNHPKHGSGGKGLVCDPAASSSVIF